MQARTDHLSQNVEIGAGRARADLKLRFLSQFAAEVIRTEHPELASKMYMQSTVLDWRSRDLEMHI